ncbi:MAG TPA: SIMPL domain-containing protein [Allosphingosinicella sp.]
MRLAGLIAAALAVSLPAAARAQTSPSAQPRLEPGEALLRIEAQGSHVSTPDVMRMTVGTVTTGRTAREATNSNNLVSAKLVAAARAFGVERRDIQTSSLSVDPQMDEDRADREGREPRITGYVAKNDIELRFRDLARAPELIDALFEAGANSVEGPRFSLSDPLPAQRLARRAAVAAAREQADTYAEALGMRVARVLQLSERGEVDAMGFNGLINSTIAPVSLEAGVLQTRVTVNVEYAIAPR